MKTDIVYNFSRTQLFSRPSAGAEDDPAEERSRQRLRDTLQLDDEAIEVVMNLRRQVLALQGRVYELEAVLDIVQAESSHRMGRYRQVTVEAAWEEVVDSPPEEES